jgi:pyrimidine-specific ribonucleoside hydrolase
MSKIPVINVTDLYHPYQDSDDNLDLLLAFGLPEIELLGVILDCHEPFRQKVAPVGDLDGLWADPTGPRDPGFVPVLQLNYLFNRNVPCAVAPFTKMRSPDDKMLEAPKFQQQGVELLLRLLSEAKESVHVIVQGSARPLALALNRDEELLREKIKCIHLCMGSTSREFLEWNIALDAHAAVRVLTSNLRVALYPCAVAEGPFSLGQHNSYWHLETLEWVQNMQPKLKRYLDFVYSRSVRMDFLRAMDEDFAPDTNEERYQQGHHLWTTALWMEMTGRRLVQTSEGCRLLAGQTGLPHALRPCRLEVEPDGRFEYTFAERSNIALYDRGDPVKVNAALNEAFPALYLVLEAP